ncbi:MAG: winged helix-turn-helix transcriptional regulator [Betaproteobacteria bacterium]|nr:winged helix-turn-helix transcriptional regulator [Betaproteobacteria bacterium]
MWREPDVSRRGAREGPFSFVLHSAREVSLLEIFLQRAGRLVSKDQPVNHLCERGEEVSANAIEVYMHRLRRKLEPGGVKIVTVRGLGYSLEKPDFR